MGWRSTRRCGRGGVIGAVLLGVLVAAAAPAAATWAQAPTSASVEVVDARVSGDGPWTSWLGGAAERRLLLTVENAGPDPVADIVVSVLVDGAEPVETPPIPVLEPGERRTVDIDISLPRLSFGTHSVEGTVDAAGERTAFRTETSHVPWLLLLLPTIVLAQVSLVAVRNRARRLLRARVDPVVQPASEPAAPAAAAEPVTAVVERELDTVLADLVERDLSDHELISVVQKRAREITDRVGDHFDLPPGARPELARSVTTALLERSTAPTVAV